MPKPKGGRGKVAPYTTRQVRVPEPIINQVDRLIEQYQDYVASGGDVANPPVFVESGLKPAEKLVFKDEIIEILKEALKLKANAGGAIKREILRVLNLLGA